MEQQLIRHTGVIESFELEDPTWPVITPKAKGEVRSALDGNLYELRGVEAKQMNRPLPLVGLRISFLLYLMGGRFIVGDIQPESASDS